MSSIHVWIVCSVVPEVDGSMVMSDCCPCHRPCSFGEFFQFVSAQSGHSLRSLMRVPPAPSIRRNSGCISETFSCSKLSIVTRRKSQQKVQSSTRTFPQTSFQAKMDIPASTRVRRATVADGIVVGFQIQERLVVLDLDIDEAVNCGIGHHKDSFPSRS